MKIELLSSTHRDAVLASHLRQWLQPLGLTEIAPRRWVDGSRPPARRLFEMALLKGAGIKACWGFSLDFVPHISAGRIRWHRSDKTAKLDVIIDLRDLPQPSYLHGPEHLDGELRLLMPDAVSRAMSDWTNAATFEGMCNLIREVRLRHTNCFGYDNYTQLPLAYAFLCARIGEIETAQQELDEYICRHHLDDDLATRLRCLLGTNQ